MLQVIFYQSNLFFWQSLINSTEVRHFFLAMTKSAIEVLEKWIFLLYWWNFDIMIHATSVVKKIHFRSTSMVVAKKKRRNRLFKMDITCSRSPWGPYFERTMNVFKRWKSTFNISKSSFLDEIWLYLTAIKCRRNNLKEYKN